MPPKPDASRLPDPDEAAALDAAVDEAIQLAGGDEMAAIRGLILGQQVLERQISPGYVRRRLQ